MYTPPPTHTHTVVIEHTTNVNTTTVVFFFLFSLDFLLTGKAVMGKDSYGKKVISLVFIPFHFQN